MTTSTENGPTWLGRWLRRLSLLAIALYLITVLADFGYSRWVKWKLTAWEAELVFNEDGVRNDCVAYQRGQGEDAILLVHGINDSPRLWDSMVDDWVEAGWTCRAMRLPGFAMRNEDYAQATLDDWLIAVNTEVKRLRAEHGRVHVVAHSLGAAVCLNYALTKPDDFDSLALLAPVIEISNQRSPILSVEAWHRLSAGLLVFTHTTFNPFSPDMQDPNAGEYPFRTKFTPRAIVDQTLRVISKNRDRGDQLNLPLFVAAAPADQVVDYAATRRFYETVSSEPRVWFDAERSGHLLPLDLDEAAIAAALQEFWIAVDDG